MITIQGTKVMDYKDIKYNVIDRVACITLNRPARLNAWTRNMAAEVRNAFHASGIDDTVRAIVFTGEGRGFCAGADMSELEYAANLELPGEDEIDDIDAFISTLTGTPTEAEIDPDNCFDARSDFRKRYSYIQAIPKPVIAAINGPAVGLGLVVALYCDIRFASETARFSTAFSRRGLIAEHGISWLLPRIVGMPNAMDLLFSARMINAKEALDMGLINKVFLENDLMENTMAYAKMLTEEVSPRSLKVIKKQFYMAQFETMAQAIESADKEMLNSLRSNDFKEGIAHFLEKRQPIFTGN